MAGIAIASAVTATVAQSNAASAQANYQQKQAEANTEYYSQNAQAALRSNADEQAAINLQTQESQQHASQEVQDIQLERMRKQGTAEASSISMANGLLADFARQEAVYKDSVKANMDMTMLQSGIRKSSVAAEAQDRINTVRPYTPSPVAQPNYIGAGLGVVSSGLSIYSDYKKNQQNTEILNSLKIKGGG